MRLMLFLVLIASPAWACHTTILLESGEFLPPPVEVIAHKSGKDISRNELYGELTTARMKQIAGSTAVSPETFSNYVYKLRAPGKVKRPFELRAMQAYAKLLGLPEHIHGRNEQADVLQMCLHQLQMIESDFPPKNTRLQTALLTTHMRTATLSAELRSDDPYFTFALSMEHFLMKLNGKAIGFPFNDAWVHFEKFVKHSGMKSDSPDVTQFFDSLRACMAQPETAEKEKRIYIAGLGLAIASHSDHSMKGYLMPHVLKATIAYINAEYEGEKNWTGLLAILAQSE